MTRRGWMGALLALAIAGCGGATAASPAPVTDAERHVIQAWADDLRHGDVEAAASHFSVPSEIVNLPPQGDLESAREVQVFNDSMPCGARLLNVSRSGSGLVLADFELTDRPGGECENVGTRATFAFLISDDHIARLILVGETPGLEDARSI